MNKLTPIAAAVLLVASSAVGAANVAPPSPPIVNSIGRVDVAPKTVNLSNGKAMASMSITQIMTPGVTASCGIRITTSDGGTDTVGKLDSHTPVQTGTVAFAKAGTQTLTVKGQAEGLLPACNGSASATVTVNPELTPEMAAAMAAAFEPPTLVSLRPVPNGRGAAANEFIEDIPLFVEVNGDKPASCGYRIIGENLVNHNTVESQVFTSFGSHLAFTFKGHTNYRVLVRGEKTGNTPACKGSMGQVITVKNDRAWINDMKLEGWAFYNYHAYHGLMRFRVASLDVRDGKACDFEVVRQIGGKKETFPMRFSGSPADFQQQMHDGVNYDEGGINGDGDLKTPPQLINTATYTLRGVGENACNGKAITKTITVPLPKWEPAPESPHVVQ